MSKFSQKELDAFRDQFNAFDADGSGSVDAGELRALMKKCGENPTDEVLRKLISEVDTNKSGTIEFDEFVQMIAGIRSGANSTAGMAKVYEKAQKLNVIKGTGASLHSFSDEEKFGFVEYMNSSLSSDAYLKEQNLVPMDPESDDIFKNVRNGVLLCKLINLAVPDTIDERALNLKAKLTPWEVAENQNLCIQSARGIGVNVTNIGAQDLTDGKPHLVLGLIWQIIRIGLLASINLKNHPFLIRLLEEGETIHDLLKLPPDQLLLRWFNFHLREAGSDRRVGNFSGDIKDSIAYTTLLHQIAPNHCDDAALRESDVHKRAELVLANAEKIECRRFVRAADIVKGNSKLNLAFVANLFNNWPGLDPPEDDSALKDLFDDENDSREERAFRMWMNSLGVEPEVHNLFEDLRDGLVLLQLFDKVKPGIVQWDKVSKQPNNVFKKSGNCNLCVQYGKDLGFSLVGIGGKDIVDGNQKLTLSVVWQLMRYYVISLIKSVATKMGKSTVDESDMVKWANGIVASGERKVTMESLKDSTLSNSLFWLALLAMLSPKSINWDVVHVPGEGEVGEELDETQKMDNAKYAISLARKVGCGVFVLWEDLVEVKSKLILTFLGAIMAKYA